MHHYNSVDEMLTDLDSKKSRLDKFLDPIRYKLEDVKSSVRRYLEKPTTIKPRWLGHYWMEPGDLMPHFVFALLDNFMKNDYSDKWNYDEPDPILKEKADEWKNAWQELKGHHEWWHKTYLPAFQDDFCFFPDNMDELKKLDKEKYKDALRLSYGKEVALNDECTKRCMRVVELRDFMWT